MPQVFNSIDTATSSPEDIQVIFDYIEYIAYLQTWDGVLPTVVTDGSASFRLKQSITQTIHGQILGEHQTH